MVLDFPTTLSVDNVVEWGWEFWGGKVVAKNKSPYLLICEDNRMVLFEDAEMAELEDWRDDSVNKVPAMQMWGPEFGFPTSLQKANVEACI